MKQVCIIILSAMCVSAFGQGKEGAPLPANQGTNLNNNNVVGWNNIPLNLAKENVPLTDVKGDRFWNQDWLQARILMKNGAVYTIRKAKLNLHSQAVHYMNEKGTELAARGGIKGIIFLSPNDTSRLGTFSVINSPDGNKTDVNEVFAQVLADGKIRFLKATTVKLVKRETDPLLAKTEWMFEPREMYLIEENGKTQEMTSISRSRIYEVVAEQNGDKDWLKNQNNKLKKEDDVIAFISYRNSLTK